MKKLAVLALLYHLIAGLAISQQIDAQQLEEAVNAKTFVFEGRQAAGLRGRMIQLDPGYTLELSPDKVVGNLPFFGRAYQATPGSADVGLKFEFSDFDYKVKVRRKGGWEITIEPKGSSDVRSVFLTIQTQGNASLRVISNSRDPMSYNGFIRK